MGRTGNGIENERSGKQELDRQGPGRKLGQPKKSHADEGEQGAMNA
jgi:hypothetical protein